MKSTDCIHWHRVSDLVELIDSFVVPELSEVFDILCLLG